MIDFLIRFAMRTPYLHLTGYMDRYWLIKPRSWLPISARVHHILRSDNDRHLHDHPWASISIILRGGYLEVMPLHQGQPAARDLSDHYLRRVWRAPGTIVCRKATDRHRLEVESGDCWTLFVMIGRRRHWGFHTENGWKFWREYLNDWTREESPDRSA